MDWADKAQASQEKQGFLRAEPLKGMDIEKEYGLIKAKLSHWSPRIQAMIISRKETGQ